MNADILFVRLLAVGLVARVFSLFYSLSNLMVNIFKLVFCFNRRASAFIGG